MDSQSVKIFVKVIHNGSNVKKLDEKDKKNEEEERFTLDISPLGFLIPFGLISGGLSIYLLLTWSRVRFFGLFLTLVGVLSMLAVLLPLVRLKVAKENLAKQERKVKLERLKEKAKEEEETSG